MKKKIRRVIRRLTQPSPLDEIRGSQTIVDFLGAKFFAGKGNKIEAKLLSTNGYDRQNLIVCERFIHPGDVCLDVGANIGIYSALMANWVGDAGSVHCFEPVSHIRRKLNLNLKINGVSNTIVNPIVLGGEAGVIPMNQIKEGAFRAGTSTLTQNESVEALGQNSFDRVDVEMRTVDSYIEDAGIKKVNFVKIDIEGYEINFLSGASRLLSHHRPVMVMEHNQARLEFLDIDEDRFKKLFSRFNYRCLELFEQDDKCLFVPYSFDRKMRGINLACIPEE